MNLSPFFNRPITTIIIVSFITAFFITQILTLETDNSLDIWYQQDDPSFQNYQQFKQTFGNDLAIYIFYTSDDLFTDHELNLNRDLTEALSNLSHVRKVTSLTNVKAFRKLPLWMTVVVPLVNKNNANLEESRFQALEDQLYRDNVVSTDGKATAIRIDLESESVATNKLVMADVKNILSGDEFASINFHLMGNVPMMVELNRISNSESGRFVMFSILAIFILLLLVFKRIRMAILPLLIASVSVIWGIGIYALAGNTLNMISGIMPLVILVVSIAHSIHIISHYDREIVQPGTDKTAVLEAVMSKLFRPCLFTSLTTVAAFLAFNFSAIPTIKKMGTFTSLGVFIPFLLSFSLLPAILTLQKRPAVTHAASQIQVKIELCLASLMQCVQKFRWFLLIFFALTFIVSISGISRIRFQTDQMNYLRTDNPVRIANHKMREWFHGVYPLEMVLSSDQSGYFFTGEGLNLIKQVEELAKAEPEVRKTLSPFSFYESYYFATSGLRGENLVIAKENEGVFSYLFNRSTNSDINNFISSDGNNARISIRSVWLNNQEVEKLIEKITNRTKVLLAENNAKALFTGTAAMYIKLNHNIIHSQINSFIASFIMIFLMLWFLFKRIKLAVIGMIPNIFPVVMSLGLIGWLGIKMDVATILIAAVTLGIAVDDTIHFLFSYTEGLSAQNSTETLLMKTINSVGLPVVLTTLFLIFGFIVMVFSSFLPIVYFGVFIVVNIIVALIADLVLLPALLISFKDDRTYPATDNSFV